MDLPAIFSGHMDESQLPERRIQLPIYNPAQAMWMCCKEYTAPSAGVECGCPLCCHERSETCVWSAQDAQKGGRSSFWGRNIVSEKLGLMTKENIVPGYPGGVDLDDTGPYHVG